MTEVDELKLKIANLEADIITMTLYPLSEEAFDIRARYFNEIFQKSKEPENSKIND